MTKKASTLFIFVAILLETLGFGIVIPVFPDVIRRFSSDPSYVSLHYGIFISLYSLMQFFMSPILGGLSDRFGRRPILLISLVGAAADYLFMALASTLPLLYVGRVISGVTGAGMTVASSYMADVSDDSNRSANFGLIGAAFGLGFVVGPMIGGLLSQYGYAAPFFGAAALNLVGFLFGWLVLPESLPKEKRRKIEVSRLNPFLSLKKVLRPSALLVLFWVYFLIYLAGQSHPSIWTLYTQEKFGWSAREVGLSLSFLGVIIAISQAWLTRVLIPKWGEENSLLIGLVFEVIAFIGFAWAPSGIWMYAVLLLFSISGLAGPALQSLISKDVPSEEQGELQGTLISIASVTSIIGPLIYTGAFSEFTKSKTHFYFPGAPYIVAAIICVVALLLYAKKIKKTRRKALP